MTTTEWYESLVEEIVFMAEATSEREYANPRRVRLAKKVLYMVLRSVPGKYWIPPLAPEDKHLGLPKNYFRAIKFVDQIIQAETENIDELIKIAHQ